MPKSYNLIDSIVDEMAPLEANQGHDYVSPTVIAMRGIIREALKRYENACTEEAVLRGEE